MINWLAIVAIGHIVQQGLSIFIFHVQRLKAFAFGTKMIDQPVVGDMKQESAEFRSSSAKQVQALQKELDEAKSGRASAEKALKEAKKK